MAHIEIATWWEAVPIGASGSATLLAVSDSDVMEDGRQN
jgi:hypothetical protein